MTTQLKKPVASKVNTAFAFSEVWLRPEVRFPIYKHPKGMVFVSKNKLYVWVNLNSRLHVRDEPARNDTGVLHMFGFGADLAENPLFDSLGSENFLGPVHSLGKAGTVIDWVRFIDYDIVVELSNIVISERRAGGAIGTPSILEGTLTRLMDLQDVAYALPHPKRDGWELHVLIGMLHIDQTDGRAPYPETD
jgi:hypothetical protein